MSVNPQILKRCLQSSAISALAAASLTNAFAQNAVSVLPAVNVNLSNPSATASSPLTFSTNTISLSARRQASVPSSRPPATVLPRSSWITTST